jgi:hypothetical protein
MPARARTNGREAEDDRLAALLDDLRIHGVQRDHELEAALRPRDVAIPEIGAE